MSMAQGPFSDGNPGPSAIISTSDLEKE